MGEPMTPETVGVPLFTYGTLRIGEGLFPYLRPIMLAADWCAILPGYALHFHRYTKSYPVIVPNSDAQTVGDIVWCRKGRDLGEILAMEHGCGYDIVRRDVIRGNGETVSAIVCEWRHPLTKGARVRSDDWSDRQYRE